MWSILITNNRDMKEKKSKPKWDKLINDIHTTSTMHNSAISSLYVAIIPYLPKELQKNEKVRVEYFPGSELGLILDDIYAITLEDVINLINKKGKLTMYDIDSCGGF